MIKQSCPNWVYFRNPGSSKMKIFGPNFYAVRSGWSADPEAGGQNTTGYRIMLLT